MPVDVGERQLRAGVWSFLPQDHPAAGGPGRQVEQSGGLGDPGAVPDRAVGVDRRVPHVDTVRAGRPGGVVEQVQRVPDRLPDGEPEREPDPLLSTELRETKGGTGGIGPDQHRGAVRVARSWPESLGDRGQRFGEHLDVIAGGVEPAFPGRSLPAIASPAAISGRSANTSRVRNPNVRFQVAAAVLLPVGMIHTDRGVHVQHDRVTGHRCRAGRPHRRPRSRPGCLHARQVRGVDPLVQQPPRRRQRRDRTMLRLLIDQRTDTGHAVRAVGDRCCEIGEDPARVVHQTR